MSRGPEINFPEFLYHVGMREIERSYIFVGDLDPYDFLERLAQCAEDEQSFVYAWKDKGRFRWNST